MAGAGERFISNFFQLLPLIFLNHGKTSGSDITLLAKEVIRIVLDSLGLKKISLANLSMGASVGQDFI